jgi:hypothetical protein
LAQNWFQTAALRRVSNSVYAATNPYAVEWGIYDGSLPIDALLRSLAITGYARLSVNLPAPPGGLPIPQHV